LETAVFGFHIQSLPVGHASVAAAIINKQNHFRARSKRAIRRAVLRRSSVVLGLRHRQFVRKLIRRRRDQIRRGYQRIIGEDDGLRSDHVFHHYSPRAVIRCSLLL